MDLIAYPQRFIPAHIYVYKMCLCVYCVLLKKIGENCCTKSRVKDPLKIR